MSLVHVATVVGIGAGAVAAVGGAYATVRPVLRRAGDFFDDWQGRPARPGVPAVPGVMERIRNLDDGQVHMITRLSAVEAQMSPDSGSSMYDRVATIEQVITSQPRTPFNAP